MSLIPWQYPLQIHISHESLIETSFNQHYTRTTNKHKRKYAITRKTILLDNIKIKEISTYVASHLSGIHICI